jgi:alcohol dehydrogenase
MLLKLLAAKKLPAEKLITHTFPFTDAASAYDVFKTAAENKTLKVIMEM